MKKILLFVFITYTQVIFADNGISLTVNSYLISRKQTASLYEKAELIINDETQSWEVILHRKDGAETEHIRLENFREASGNGVFQKVSIQEGGKTSGQGLFGHVPVFNNKIQIDLCDYRTEAVRRRLILGF
jgi:hypothetical protein